MSELSALLGLYTGVDAIASRDVEQLVALAEVIPVYRWDSDKAVLGPDRRTVGWSSRLQELSDKIVPLSLDEALAAFDSLPDPTPLEQAKRLRAAWMVLHVRPDTGMDAVSLLRPLVRAARSGDDPSAVDEARITEETGNLIRFLAGDTYSLAEDWPEVVEACLQNGWVIQPVAMLAMVSCQDQTSWIRRPDGDIDPAARIRTSIRGWNVGGLSIDEVRLRLQPANWPTCLAHFWCGMRPITPPSGSQGASTWYQEVVGDCPDEWFDPYLRFDAMDHHDDAGVVTGFEIQYSLATEADIAALNVGRNVALAQDSRLTVDSGMIIVDRQPSGALVDITTTKTIGFAKYPTGGVALLACITGWADQTRAMMAGCLGSP